MSATETMIDEMLLARAEEIAGEGKYEDIVRELQEIGVLVWFVQKIRDTYGHRLAADNFTMSDRDFEMLAVLGLYDINTLEHSIRTFELAKRVITHPFVQSGATIILGDFLVSASVSHDQFLRAALFHDIGKVIIPRDILHNALDDEEVLTKMFPEESFEENLENEKAPAKKTILRELYENGIRPIDVVPLKEIFTGEKYAELFRDLQKRGFSETATLKDVIRMHEPEGQRILTSAGYTTEGELAGRHHNYEKEFYSHVIHTPCGTFGVADLIRIADVTDALRSARWYKKPLSEIEVLFILTQDAEVGKINPALARLWIRDQCAELQNQTSLAGGDENQEAWRAIQAFLAEETASA